MQIRTIMISLGASLFVAMPAFADGFYIDGGISLIAVDGDDLIDPVIDPQFESLGAHFGVDVSKHFSVEGEAIIGLNSEYAIGWGSTIDLGGDPAQYRWTDFRTDTSLNYIVGAYARADFPITSKLNVFGRLGYAQVELDQNTRVRSAVSNNEEELVVYSVSNISVERGPAFGAGATYDLTDKIYVRGDLTRYDIDFGELDNLMFGAGIRF